MSKPSCPRNQEHQWKAAIATNNVAVALLDRGCYREAMYTFQDSMHLMKASLTALALPDHEITHAMQNACLRSVAKSTSSEDSTTLVITSQQDPWSVHEMLNEAANKNHPVGESKTTIFCCTKIDPVDNEDFSESIDIHSSLLLYNFGVAHLALAEKLERTTKDISGLVQKLRESGFHLLRLCETNLTARLASDASSYQNSTILLVSLNLARTLLQLAHQLDYEEMRVHYDAVYAEVVGTIEAFASLLPLASLGHAAAA